jgi:hypothetical protein
MLRLQRIQVPSADAAITLRVYAHVLHDDAARVADVFAQALGVRVDSA